ncbi:MAG TPA: DoxX family protein [Ferruginibacter sp.]|nr:DoxX family protein [Ferruginibacter sp.]
MHSSKYQTLLLWILRIVAAVIMLQTLYFKFSASPESVYIFTTVGIEPWGRIASGVAELIASVLILVPRTSWMGAFMAIGVMSGAIFFHFTTLGIEVMNDGGQLFVYALLVFACSLLILFINRQPIIHQLQSFLKLKDSTSKI